MTRSATITALSLAAAFLLGPAVASAQSFHFGISPRGISIGSSLQRYNSHRVSGDHGYSHIRHRTPDVRLLDQYADQLSKVAEHLHEDAHQLSAHYEHSCEIERHVSKLDEVAEHIHEILHDASIHNSLSFSAQRHLQSDARLAKSAMLTLSAHLRHQGFDGAQTHDYKLMCHMQELIASEAFPLIAKIDSCLNGHGYRSHDSHWSDSHWSDSHWGDSHRGDSHRGRYGSDPHTARRPTHGSLFGFDF